MKTIYELESSDIRKITQGIFSKTEDRDNEICELEIDIENGFTFGVDVVKNVTYIECECNTDRGVQRWSEPDNESYEILAFDLFNEDGVMNTTLTKKQLLKYLN